MWWWCGVLCWGCCLTPGPGWGDVVVVQVKFMEAMGQDTHGLNNSDLYHWFDGNSSTYR